MALNFFKKTKSKPVALISIPPDCSCFHITHWKAGSQWVGGILKDAFAGLVVKPAGFEEQVLNRPIQTGRVYSCAYLAEPEFRRVPDADQMRLRLMRHHVSILASRFPVARVGGYRGASDRSAVEHRGYGAAREAVAGDQSGREGVRRADDSGSTEHIDRGRQGSGCHTVESFDRAEHVAMIHQLPFRPLSQLSDGRWRWWCPALDNQSGRCTIYETRPKLCADYAAGSDPICVHYQPEFDQ